MVRLAAALAALALLGVRPPPGAEPVARLAFLGDAGTGGGEQRAVAAQILKLDPQLVVLLGDNIYGRGRASDFEKKHDRVYAPLLSRGVRFHAALGNHDVWHCPPAPADPLPADAGAYRFGEDGCDVELALAHAPFGYRGGRRYYSVATAEQEPLVEVFVLDSNTLASRKSKLKGSGREDRAQLEWLERALAASRARWKLVALHHPPHSPRGSGYWGFVEHERESGVDAQLDPILRRHGVDAAFAGHNHFYARMAPQAGVRYFVSGGGGRRLYRPQPAPGYALAAGAFFHVLSVSATPSRLEYQAIDDRGAVRDAGWFGKGDATDTPPVSARKPGPAAPE